MTFKNISLLAILISVSFANNDASFYDFGAGDAGDIDNAGILNYNDSGDSGNGGYLVANLNQNDGYRNRGHNRTSVTNRETGDGGDIINTGFFNTNISGGSGDGAETRATVRQNTHSYGHNHLNVLNGSSGDGGDIDNFGAANVNLSGYGGDASYVSVNVTQN